MTQPSWFAAFFQGAFFYGKAACHTLRGRAFPVKKVYKKLFRSC